jgi:hypothetical protein
VIGKIRARGLDQASYTAALLDLTEQRLAMAA